MPSRTLLMPAAAIALAACSAADGVAPAERPSLSQTAAAPAGVVAATASLSIYPYTLVNFSSAPAERFDPINLVFTGRADPREIRADLMALDGNRPGLPSAPFFDCVWRDAIGDMQTAYSAGGGWSGSTIQLRCGEFGPVRFHLRLFRAGAVTIANAHFEVLIENTADHQVLSWDLAEQLVLYDMVRTGLLDAAPSATAVINTSAHRAIPAVIFNLLPPELRALVSGSPEEATADVPISNGDGRATVISLGGAQGLTPGTFTESLPLTYGQVIPRPFCSAGPLDYVHVAGPVSLEKSVTISADGSYSSTFAATGRLQVTPVNPLTGEPSGAPYEAEVGEHQESWLDDDGEMILALVRRHELPQGVAGRGRLQTRLRIEGAVTQFSRTEDCD
ncbi:MAG: hypothetical protein ACM357_08125 [Gemmatimonadota bacterium]